MKRKMLSRKAKQAQSGLVSPQLPMVHGKAKVARSQGSGIVGGVPIDFGVKGGSKVGPKTVGRAKPTKMY